jgi:hypothetical protein
MKKAKNIWAGIVGGFTATTCCIAPIALILLGFGTALSMAVMHQFHLVSIVSGILLMILISLYIVRREKGVCNLKTIKQSWKGIGIAIIVMVFGWLIINYLIIGSVASVVYGDLNVNQKPLGNLVEMAESHGMPEMANIEVIPENQGKKVIDLEIKGVFCGACGPAIEYDIKSISGVLETKRLGTKVSVIYDSDITSKDVITASVHDPYSAKIVKEEILSNE